MVDQSANVIEDNFDIVLVIGDVGVDVVHKDSTVWTGAGGTALNLADMLCDKFQIQSWILTKYDPVTGWLTDAVLRRFIALNEGLGNARAYEVVTPKMKAEVFDEYADLDLSTRLSVAIEDNLRFNNFCGRDIDLTGQSTSIQEAIDGSVATVIDTRLTKETIAMITQACADLSLPLMVMSNDRALTLDKLEAIGRYGGCHLLVLKTDDLAPLQGRDPCEVTNADLVGYVRPLQRNWSIHQPGHKEVMKGTARIGDGEKYRDSLGAIEGFTTGYISAILYEGLTIENRETAVSITEGYKEALTTMGGNKLALRDPDNPDLTIAGA